MQEGFPTAGDWRTRRIISHCRDALFEASLHLSHESKLLGFGLMTFDKSVADQPVFLMPAAIPLMVNNAPRNNSPLL
ncbi:hypothetical protein SAMD00079811_36110 [Scytonema sp. HK-05]|nr:hypothetical protein SAMD00079811_36110 [Scytonema sp. HK-05]